MHRRAMSILLASAAALAVLPAMEAAGATNKVALSAQESRRFEFRRENLWGGGSPWDNGRRFRRGWSNRHVQRMAAKKRNQARHRRACRG